MGGHVVVALVDVPEQRRSVGHQVDHEAFQVTAHSGVGVLAKDERGAGMFDENMAQAGDDVGGGNHFLYILGDVVSAAPGGEQVELFLISHDCQRELPDFCCLEELPWGVTVASSLPPYSQGPGLTGFLLGRPSMSMSMGVVASNWSLSAKGAVLSGR